MVPLCATCHTSTQEQALPQKHWHINGQRSRWILSGVYGWIFVCVPELQGPAPIKAKLSCSHPLHKWLVITLSSLDPQRATNCMCYHLLCIPRKCRYLYWYAAMTYQLPSTKDYVSWFQTNLPGWKECFLSDGLMICLCTRIWTVVNMFCLFSGQRQFGLAITQRKSGSLKIGWGGQ